MTDHQVTKVLDVHAQLGADGYDLRTIRLDSRNNGRVIVGLIWRRRHDRHAEVRHCTLKRADAQTLLTGLGGLTVL